jgi:hypothetical protein
VRRSALGPLELTARIGESKSWRGVIPGKHLPITALLNRQTPSEHHAQTASAHAPKPITSKNSVTASLIGEDLREISDDLADILLSQLTLAESVIGLDRVIAIEHDRHVGVLAHAVPAVPQRKARIETEERFEWTWNDTPSVKGWVGGLWPWMRQGWTFLDNPAADGSTLTLPGVIELTEHLKSGRFATLDAQGGRELAGLFKLGQGPNP